MIAVFLLVVIIATLDKVIKFPEKSHCKIQNDMTSEDISTA